MVDNKKNPMNLHEMNIFLKKTVEELRLKILSEFGDDVDDFLSKCSFASAESTDDERKEYITLSNGKDDLQLVRFVNHDTFKGWHIVSTPKKFNLSLNEMQALTNVLQSSINLNNVLNKLR